MPQGQRAGNAPEPSIDPPRAAVQTSGPHSETILANNAHPYTPAPPCAAGIAALDALVWQLGYRAVAVIGASKNAGKTTALNALSAALGQRNERAGLCSVGVDGESSDAWLATPKPAVTLAKGALVVTAQQAVHATAGRLKVLQTLDFDSSLGPNVLAEARAPGPVMLCGLAHRAQLAQAMAALWAAGADRVLVDGAYHRQAAADALGIDALVLAVGAVLPLADAVPTLRALATPQDLDEVATREVRGGLTDARLAQLDLAGVRVLRVASQGAVLLGAAGHALLARHGVRLTARHTRPLACLTANPHRHDGSGSTEAADAFAARVRDWACAQGVSLPVVDVVAGICRVQGLS